MFNIIWANHNTFPHALWLIWLSKQRIWIIPKDEDVNTLQCISSTQFSNDKFSILLTMESVQLTAADRN